MSDLSFKNFWLTVHKNSADGQRLHIKVTPREAKRAKARGFIRPKGFIETSGRVNMYFLTQRGIEEYRLIFKGCPPFDDPDFNPEVISQRISVAHLD